jgi:GrpB-like predicted nucleotidyltransferase (UPF0157 family)
MATRHLQAPSPEIQHQPVRISSPDPGWVSSYDDERAALEKAIGEWAVGGIHHVGSTAVPGLDAEPVIDILIGTGDAAASLACAAPLAELGYSFELRRSAEAHSLCKPHPRHRTHDLHLAPTGSRTYSEMLAFRDFLRSDLQAAIGYAGMKRDLADRHGGDRRAYAAGKEALIRTVLDRVQGFGSAL